MLSPVETTSQKPVDTLDGMVREKIRTAILTGGLPHGTHLSEIKLSKEYGVSRTPVREALSALAADGLIEMFPNRGAFVKTPDATMQHELTSLYSFLMGLAANIATDNLSETDFARFERWVTMLANGGSEADKAFASWNDMMLTVAANDTLCEMVALIRRRLPESVYRIPQASQQLAHLHQQLALVVNAWKAKKPETAEKTMRELMLFGFDANAQKVGAA